MNPIPPYSSDTWERLPAEPLPRSTHYPAFLAMGTTLIFWGLISSWMTLFMGFYVFGSALAGWIKEIRHERKNHPH
ncbi:MAG TPA: hypothetical protein VGM64_20950 [Lacunisphaera sp.]|jgi:hypothetical protein